MEAKVKLTWKGLHINIIHFIKVYVKFYKKFSIEYSILKKFFKKAQISIE